MHRLVARLPLISCFFLIAIPFAQRGNCEVNANVAAQVGLVVAWESNIGGASLAHGQRSFVLWPHSTAKTEYVTVRMGDRFIQRFDGDEVDQAAIEKSILDGERLIKTPKLGLKGAEAQAQKLVATYKKLGKTLDIEPYSQRLIYIVTLSKSGIIEVMDAETGAIFWKSEVGDSRLEMYGPGVSDDYVAVTNGNRLYAFDIQTGAQITSRSLPFTPTGTLAISGTKAIVPSIEGRLVAYDILDHKIPAIVLRSGTENRMGVTLSNDRMFMSWPMNNRLFIAKLDPAKLWTSIAIDEPVSNVATPTPVGFVFTGLNGTLVHCSTERAESVLWKIRLSVPVSKSPIVNQTTAFIPCDDGQLFAVNLADSSEVWDRPVRNIVDVVGVGKKHLYATNASGYLTAIDLATGRESARTNSLVPTVVPNALNDRFYFISSDGQLSCLREPDAVVPTFVSPINQDDKAGVKSPTPKETTESTESPTINENIFGESSTSQETTSANPFGDPL